MPERHDHWIGGKPQAPASGVYLPTVNPIDGQPGEYIAAGNSLDAALAVESASDAQPEWARLPASERSEVLHCIAETIDAKASELMDLERRCTGKVTAQLDLEIKMSASYFHYYAGALRAVGGHTIDHGALSHVYTRLEPYGVVAVITPWNLPLNQACRAVAPALAVGNAVVVKPSEFTSISTTELGRLASAAGLAPGLLNVVSGTGINVGTPLANHPDVRRIAFTGSVATGRHLAKLAAERLIPTTLELGGKSPLVIFADADLDRAVAAAVRSVAFNTGQVCSATTRILIERTVHEEVSGRISSSVARLEPGIDFGPMITKSQYEKVLKHLADAGKNGLKPTTGGRAYESGPASEGWFVQPAVFVDVDPDLDIAREEIFGPVLVTMPFDSEHDAVERANDSEYGLVGGVWSGNAAQGLRIAEQLKVGQVSVNGGPLTIETPFGGFKQSGYGREKGLEALHEYAQTKTISLSLE
jgi:acyl-CoA reductase-like NAD-dependent aldehyde dehydrogenase